MKMISNGVIKLACLLAVSVLFGMPLFAKDVTTDAVDMIDGPLLDKESDSGDLYGDLYRLARYQGGETKKVPAVDLYGNPIFIWVPWTDPDGRVSATPVKQQKWTTAPAVGGEPKLTEEFAVYTIIDESTNEYVINPATGGIYYRAPFPSQCVQPVADAVRWGDIYEKSGLTENRIPLVMTYDPTWKRTECEAKPDLFLAAGETWHEVTYYKNIYWVELIQEVDFGRLNLARAPKAVLDAAFDEAVRSINAAKDIKIDASGRLMLTTEIYDEFLTDEDGKPVLLETVEKAVDSPRENIALYLKLLRDGHLITPAAERSPIDYSVLGGIPLIQLLGLEDGPSSAPRPTIDIDKLVSFGLGHLVDAANIVTYYIQMNEDGTLQLDSEGNMIISTTACTGCTAFKGILAANETDVCAGLDFPLAASFFAAAADKKGNITTDKIVYINSILGLNKVVGYSAYDADGNPLPGAINYAKNPVYFNFNTVTGYDRLDTFGRQRGRARDGRLDKEPYEYDGTVVFLEEVPPGSGTWGQTVDFISRRVFNDVNVDATLVSDVAGFTSMSDDDLQVIKYTHTYQIPGLR